MSQHYVFVKNGDIRDFDDIYEGMVPEPILSANDLKTLLSSEFELTQWDVLENRMLVGRNPAKHIEVTIDAVGDKAARMVTVNGIDQKAADALAAKLDLSELE